MIRQKSQSCSKSIYFFEDCWRASYRALVASDSSFDVLHLPLGFYTCSRPTPCGNERLLKSANSTLKQGGKVGAQLLQDVVTLRKEQLSPSDLASRAVIGSNRGDGARQVVLVPTVRCRKAAYWYIKVFGKRWSLNRKQRSDAGLTKAVSNTRTTKHMQKLHFKIISALLRRYRVGKDEALKSVSCFGNEHAVGSFQSESLFGDILPDKDLSKKQLSYRKYLKRVVDDKHAVEANRFRGIGTANPYKVDATDRITVRAKMVRSARAKAAAKKTVHISCISAAPKFERECVHP